MNPHTHQRAGCQRQAAGFGALDVVRRHGVARPAEQRFELGVGAAAFGDQLGRGLPEAVRGSFDAGGVAGGAEPGSEALLGARTSARAGDEGEVAAQASQGRGRTRASVKPDGADPGDRPPVATPAPPSRRRRAWGRGRPIAPRGAMAARGEGWRTRAKIAAALSRPRCDDEWFSAHRRGEKELPKEGRTRARRPARALQFARESAVAFLRKWPGRSRMFRPALGGVCRSSWP